MRKRIGIALVAVVAIGVIAFVLTQPKKGTVEWHKREYLQAHARPWQDWLDDARGITWSPHTWTLTTRQLDHIETHQRALIRLGYLEERVFVASNMPLVRLSSAIQSAYRKKGTGSEFGMDALSGTNAIRVVRLKGQMVTIEEVTDAAEMNE